MKISNFSVLGLLLVFSVLIFHSNLAEAQLASCDPTVPFFEVDLTGQPDGSWESPDHVRRDNCCGTTSPDRCTSYEVTLDPGAAMINLEIASGAMPPGALFYQIDCGPEIPVGEAICISGVGPHRITFCKPGNNTNTYRISSIAMPIFPDDITTRIGCTSPFNIFGLESISINSINSSNGVTTPGAFNSLLSCTDCADPIFTPGLATPSWIDYEICGGPLASICGYVPVCDTVRIFTLTALSASSTPNPAFFCAGGPGVELTASGAGGDGNYFYVWTDSDGTELSSINTVTATSEGTFTVEVGDGLNSSTCPSDFISIPVTEGQPPIVDAGADQTVCAESPTVFLTGSVENATGGIWSGGTGTFNPSDTDLLTAYTPSNAEIAANSVTLTLTSTGAGGGCVDDSDVVTIFFSDTVFVNPTADVIACSGDLTNLFSNPSGGTSPFTYIWSNGQTTENITASAGTYSVMVTDQFGCGSGASITVNNPDQLLVSTSTTVTSVDGACDGTATVNISGGVGPYSVLWSDGQTTATATNLCAGLYTATVTDANGCIREVSVVVNDPLCNNLNITIASFTDVTCYGFNNGSAQTTTTGGVGPFTYSWNTNPVQNDEDAIDLSAGVYEVTVTDGATGCQSVATVTINQPTIITNTITSSDATSIGGTDGEATANPSGGTPPYQYSWVPSSQTTQTASNLSAGTYYVTIVDDNSCIKTDSVLINQPPCNNFLLAVSPTNISCNGETDGSASLIIAHGTPPYSITWTDAASNVIATDVTSVSGLAAGSYTVEVTDDSNCTTFKTFDITEPDALSIGLLPTNVSCFNAGDGTIDLSVSGGTFSYSFEWYLGTRLISTSEDITNLSPGTYSVIVTDANGCQISASVGITQPAQLSVNNTFTNITCFEANDGTINTTVSGGTLVYSYAWTGPNGFVSTDQNLTALDYGNYFLVVTDGNGCTTPEEEVFISEPNLVVIDSISAPCPIAGESSITAEVVQITGGTEGPYQISWNNGATYNASGDYTETLAIGASYDVVALDANGCITATPFVLNLNSGVEIDTVIFDYCIPVAATQIPIEVVANGGTGQYEVSLNGGTTFNALGDYTFNVAVATSYDIVVRDENGCLSVAYTITVPAELQATATLTNEVSCIGEADGAVSLMVSGGTPSYSYEWSESGTPFSTDQNISGLTEGTYDVVVTDFYGCTTTTSIFVSTFLDVTDPEILCPSNISEPNDPTVCGAVINYTAPVGSDNCPGVTTALTAGLASGSVFPVGTTTVTYTATDLAGNTTTCSFQVTVNDTENPTISNCPANIAIPNNGGDCGAVATWTVPTANDNCGISTFTSSHNSGDVFPVGTTTVTYTATDVAGLTETCQFDVTINDTENPTITSCPINIVLPNDGGVCGAVATWTAPTANDNCGVTSFTSTHNPGDLFPVGTTTVTYTATDAAGLTATCQFDVTVNDTEIPTILCQPTVNTIADFNDCFADASGVNLGTPVTGDNCGVASISNDAPAQYAVGSTIVTWTVLDVNGNSETCQQIVNVADNQAPMISDCGVTGSLTVNTDLGECTYTNNGTGWDVVATDNCTTTTSAYALTGATSSTGTSLDGVVFNSGTTTVTWTVTDGSGNTSVCFFDIVVEDDEDPVITDCPTNIVLTNDAVICGAVATWTAPTASDNCTVASFTSTHNPGDTFPVGTTTVTYTVTDAIGNTAICEFTVTVTDNEDPTISNCPANITAQNDLGECNAAVSWIAPTANDNCSVTSFTSSHNPGDIFPVGTTTVTYTAVDAAGNTTLCQFDVTVNDTENPTIICQPSVTVIAEPGECYSDVANVNLGTPVPGDNCGVASVTNDAPAQYPVGVTNVTWTVTDVNGNSSSCIQTLTVLDNQDPIINSCGVIGNVTESADNGECTFTNNGSAWDVDATDNCTNITVAYELSGATTGTGTTLDGVAFNLGVTTVVWTVTDDANNEVTCSFTVTVEDNEIPTIIDCPINIIQNVDLGECGAEVTWTAPTFTDNCVGATIASNFSPGDFFPVGTTTVVYTVTDGSGNEATCSFDITITDDEAPVLDCPAAIASCDSLVTYNLPTATDNCGVASIQLISGLPSGSIFPVGISQITYEATDIHGNTSTCSFDIEIYETPEVDGLATDVTCNGLDDGSITLTISAGQSPFTFNWDNGQTDQNLTDLSPGIYSVEVIDANGCTTSDTFEIVQPDELSIEANVAEVLCYGDNNGSIDVSVMGGTMPYTYQWDNGEVTEDLAGLLAGNYELTVTDFNGCEIIEIFTVNQPDSLYAETTVLDATCTAPNGSILVEHFGGTGPFTYAWNDGSTNQNLSNVVAGIYTLIITDANGCSIEIEEEIGTVSYINAEVSVTNLLCYGNENGSAVVTADLGNPPFTFEWSHGPTTPFVDGLAAGDYTVTVTDAYGCSMTIDVVITEPDPIEVDLFSPDLGNGFNVMPYGNDNGSISGEAFGGTPPYSFDWADGSNSEDLSNLTAGMYSVVVTDANGCTARATITLKQPMVLEMPSGISPNNDDKNDFFVVRGIEAYPENELRVFNRWGNLVYQKNNYANEWKGENNQDNPLPDGTYFVIFDAFTSDGAITLKGYVDIRRSK